MAVEPRAASAQRSLPELVALIDARGELIAPSESLLGAVALLATPAQQDLHLALPSGQDIVLGAARDEPLLLPSAVRHSLEALGAWVTLSPQPDGSLCLGGALPDATEESLQMLAPLLRSLRRGEPVRADLSELSDAALDVWARPGFDVFVSLPRLRFTPFAHQLRATETVLRRMRGRAILADEVGLGKTIEAGLVLSELYLRRLASRTLILLPAGLVEQWCEELDQKFALPVVAYGSASWDAAAQPLDAPLVVASIAAARRAPLREELVARDWDLVIVDEAHRLKNPRTASASLVKSLRTRYLLLLTATPVENRLDDLFQLVNLVRPGHLGTPHAFKAQHQPRGVDGVGGVTHLPLLQRQMRDVMVRHRRSEVALMLPHRLAETVRVAPAVDEAELYEAVSRRVRQQARGATPSLLLGLRSVQRLAGSSPRALGRSLERLGWDDLAAKAQSIGSSEKARVLLERLRRHLAAGEKVIVFTAFRESLNFLAEQIAAAGLPVVHYHGGLLRREKEEAVRLFAADVPLFLTTEAAGEGRNLQFCHVMINFDLPWNPMQIEQRLGRIHRIGQQHDVLLTNLVSRGTIEERILGVLEAKINLFELVVGELDMILGRIEDDFDLESFIFSSYVESEGDEDFAARLDTLGDSLAAARHSYLDSRSENDLLVEEGDSK